MLKKLGSARHLRKKNRSNSKNRMPDQIGASLFIARELDHRFLIHYEGLWRIGRSFRPK
jgi:hypothetical protein